MEICITMQMCSAPPHCNGKKEDTTKDAYATQPWLLSPLCWGRHGQSQWSYSLDPVSSVWLGLFASGPVSVDTRRACTRGARRGLLWRLGVELLQLSANVLAWHGPKIGRGSESWLCPPLCGTLDKAKSHPPSGMSYPGRTGLTLNCLDFTSPKLLCVYLLMKPVTCLCTWQQPMPKLPDLQGHNKSILGAS